jgi:hypothetical protein
MRIIEKRFSVTNGTTPGSPLVARLDLGRQFLKSVIVDGNGAKTAVSGFRITNRSQPVFPDSAEGVTIAEYGYHSFPSNVTEYAIGRKLQGPPADIEIAFYNTDSAAVVVSLTFTVDDLPVEMPQNATDSAR